MRIIRETLEQMEPTPTVQMSSTPVVGKVEEPSKPSNWHKKGRGIMHFITGIILLPIGIAKGNLDAIDQGLTAFYRAGLIKQSLNEQRPEGKDSDNTPTASFSIEDMKSSD